MIEGVYQNVRDKIAVFGTKLSSFRNTLNNIAEPKPHITQFMYVGMVLTNNNVATINT